MANWIQKAIKNPGALRAAAKAAGALKDDDTISESWLKGKASQPGKIGQRARLALALRKMR